MWLTDMFMMRPNDESRPHPGPGQMMILFKDLSLHCEECRDLTEASLRAIDGTIYTEADLEGQTVLVIFDPTRTDPEYLRQAVSRITHAAEVKENLVA